MNRGVSFVVHTGIYVRKGGGVLSHDLLFLRNMSFGKGRFDLLSGNHAHHLTEM